LIKICLYVVCDMCSIFDICWPGVKLWCRSVHMVPFEMYLIHHTHAKIQVC
jgi:hypothetical protein